MLDTTIITAGIDTSKESLDIAIHGGAAFTVGNDKTGWRHIASKLRRARVGRIGIEATGGYERDVTRFLQDKGFTVVVIADSDLSAHAFQREAAH
jgi:transposase